MMNNELGLIVMLTSIQNISDAIGGTFSHLFGGEIAIGIFVFLFFVIITFILGLGILVGSVVLIPAMIVVSHFIGDFRIILAVILGLIFGMALNKMVRR